jgi:hypothetical protein
MGFIARKTFKQINSLQDDTSAELPAALPAALTAALPATFLATLPTA